MVLLGNFEESLPHLGLPLIQFGLTECLSDVIPEIKCECVLLIGAHLLHPFVLVKMRHHGNDLLKLLNIEASIKKEYRSYLYLPYARSTESLSSSNVRHLEDPA